MPFMDGYESTEKIRQFLYEHNIDQPIILAVTGHTEANYVERAINSGMN
jgi:CheY-like chemotaxis protein